MTRETTGPVRAWKKEQGVGRVVGWVAVYADHDGPPRVFSSRQNDKPRELPADCLQLYLVFWYDKSGNLYTTWLDGHDRYYLIGRRKPVLGLLLDDERWSAMQALGHELHAKRTEFADAD